MNKKQKVTLACGWLIFIVLLVAGMTSGCVQIGSGTLNARMTMWRSNDTDGDNAHVDTSMGTGGSLTADVPITGATP